jgi:hypothetical protein
MLRLSTSESLRTSSESQSRTDGEPSCATEATPKASTYRFGTGSDQIGYQRRRRDSLIGYTQRR